MLEGAIALEGPARGFTREEVTQAYFGLRERDTRHAAP
jgi:hypothetical protein